MTGSLLVDKQFICYNLRRSDRPLTHQRFGPRQGRNRIVWFHRRARGETKRHFTRHQKIVLLLVLVIILSLLFIFPPAAAIQNQSNEPTTPAQPKQADLNVSSNTQSSNTPLPQDPPRPKTPGHSIKANGKVDPVKLATWLAAQKSPKANGSPLAEYAVEILQSDYWSTIIGICYIEQYHCTSAPYNNYWGIGGEPLKHFASIPDAVVYLDNLLRTRYEARGLDTIEKLNGVYKQPARDYWAATIIKIKAEVEAL